MTAAITVNGYTTMVSELSRKAVRCGIETALAMVRVCRHAVNDSRRGRGNITGPARGPHSWVEVECSNPVGLGLTPLQQQHI